MPIPIQKLRRFRTRTVWVIKHKTADHETASGFYTTYESAKKDIETIPGRGDCDGNCVVGCRNDYEIVPVTVSAKPIKVRKLKVVSV